MTRIRVKGGMGKRKGASFERNICQRLSQWVSNFRRDDVFWRSAMSGGRATLKSRKKEALEYAAQLGDISAIHPMGHALVETFIIDCKFYKDLRLDKCFYDLNSLVCGDWNKLRLAAQDAGKLPMMIARQNLKPIELVILNGDGFSLFRASSPNIPLYGTLPQRGMRIVHLRDLFLLKYDLLKPHLRKP